MININNKNINLIISCEDYTSIDYILSSLTLDTTNILIICSELFFQRWMQIMYQHTDMEWFDKHEKELEKGFINMNINYKNKFFNFNFVITEHEEEEIQHPIEGKKIYSIGHRKIEI